jgi:hypothetical protein
VTDVARSGRVKGRARVAYRFSSLRHDSERYDIKTATIAHEAEATKKKDATKIAIGAGAGRHSARFSAAEAAPPRAPRLAVAPARARCSRHEAMRFAAVLARSDDAIDRAAHGGV